MHHNKSKKLVITAIVIVLIILGAFAWYQNYRYNYFLQTPVDLLDDTKISLSIKQGASVNEITEALSAKNLLIDKEAFKTYLKAQGLDRKIVAGRFLLNKTQPIPEIAKTITDAKSSQVILTIPEGSKVIDIDKKLTDAGVITAGDFITAVKTFDSYDKYPFLDKEKQKDLANPLEGFLFPDTYFIEPQNFASEDLIQMMLNNFQKKTGDTLISKNSRTAFETIIMASMVEKEVRTEKDLATVAGILWKRLDEDWMIGADSTLLYLKENNTIDYNDLKEDSPYNTRNHQGLPPGPICNPGIKSIMAALNPEESSYYFYLTKPETGEVVYAVTNDEHNANKAKYLY